MAALLHGQHAMHANSLITEIRYTYELQTAPRRQESQEHLMLESLRTSAGRKRQVTSETSMPLYAFLACTAVLYAAGDQGQGHSLTGMPSQSN